MKTDALKNLIAKEIREKLESTIGEVETDKIQQSLEKVVKEVYEKLMQSEVRVETEVDGDTIKATATVSDTWELETFSTAVLEEIYESLDIEEDDETGQVDVKFNLSKSGYQILSTIPGVWEVVAAELRDHMLSLE